MVDGEGEDDWDHPEWDSKYNGACAIAANVYAPSLTGGVSLIYLGIESTAAGRQKCVER